MDANGAGVKVMCLWLEKARYVSDYIMACKLTFELLLPLDELPLPLDELPLPLDELFDPPFPFPPNLRSITSDLSKLWTR